MRGFTLRGFHPIQLAARAVQESFIFIRIPIADPAWFIVVVRIFRAKLADLIQLSVDFKSNAN